MNKGPRLFTAGGEVADFLFRLLDDILRYVSALYKNMLLPFDMITFLTVSWKHGRD